MKERRYGCLKVGAHKKNVYVSYSGNMGTRMNTVIECFEALFGKGAWERLKGLKHTEKGSPDYSYCLTTTKHRFVKEFGGQFDLEL